MQVKILGIRGEIEEYTPEHKLHSGVLIDGVLFDVGEKEYLDLKPKAIFITHCHPDHAFWLREKDYKVTFEYYYPENIKLLEPIKIGGLTVTPIPTIHSKKVRSVAYLIQKGSSRILYTGDMIWIRKKYHKYLLDLDLVITDGSFSQKGGMIRRDKKTGEVYGHQGISNLVDFFKKLNAKHIIFTHFGSWMMKDPKNGKDQIRSYSNSTQVDAAKDGTLIELKENADLGTTSSEGVESVTPKVTAKLQPKAGLYLVKPHAEMIASGEKTLIVKSKKFTSYINEPLYLLEDSLCYGVITLKEPREISPEEFEKLRDKHRISDKEAFEHWGWKKEGPLFAYEFNIDETWDPPLPVKIPQGVQVFVKASNIKFLELKSLMILDLFNLADVELDEEIYSEVAQELFNRNVYSSQVFELIRGWIEDYDPTKPNDRQLGDDYRIVLGWYSSIKRGKKLFKRVGNNEKEITLEDCKALALKIFKEMIRRGFTFNRPETYKKHARELYEWLISQIGEKNIPFKDQEQKAKTVPKPTKVERPNLEDIDDVYVSQLTDEQLIALHARLHEIFREMCKEKQVKQNA